MNEHLILISYTTLDLSRTKRGLFFFFNQEDSSNLASELTSDHTYKTQKQDPVFVGICGEKTRSVRYVDLLLKI